MRWITTGGIAAALALSAGLFVIHGTSRTVNAAEALTQAAQASKSYKGWVHTRDTVTGEDPKNYSILHFNNDTGTWISEVHSDGALEVQMYVPSEKAEIKYDSKSNEIHMGEVYANFAEHWKTMVQQSALTITDALKDSPAIKIRETSDGALNRFDITPSDDAKKSRETAQPSDSPRQATAWTDPKTNLIQKVQVNVDGKIETSIYTYGEPAIRDIYDVGVPRDAKIIDSRPTPAADDVFARLEKRYKTGFGDYVAVETETDEDADGKLDPTHGAITLYSTTGKAWLMERFLFGDRTDGHGKVEVHRPALPQGWPTPALTDVLSAVKNWNNGRGWTPSEYMISDGTTAWANLGLGQKTLDSEEIPVYQMRTALPSFLWRTCEAIGLFGADGNVTVLTDNVHPGLIALHTEQITPGRDMKRQKNAGTYWMDPARNDLSIETLLQTYQPDVEAGNAPPRVENDIHTIRTQFEKTTNGTWYPAAWRTVIASHGPAESLTSEQNHLQVWSGKTLPANYFEAPAFDIPR